MRSSYAKSTLAAVVDVGIGDGALVLLKWIAVVAMVVDHVNGYLYANGSVLAQSVGRLAFPLFAYMVGYNWARMPTVRWSALVGRLTLAGLAAQPFYAVMVGDPWRLNVFFTFLAALLLLVVLQQAASWQRAVGAVFLFAVAGLVVDYYWYGILLPIAAYWLARQRSRGALLGVVAATGLLVLSLAVQIGWPALAAALALPLVMGMRRLAPVLPRWRWFFYVFYPAHLGVLVTWGHDWQTVLHGLLARVT